MTFPNGALLAWYRIHSRDLPWRRTSDPYAVWVSEIMLQQTQVVTAQPYYERWMKRFPSLEALANASEEDALSLWQGLGYYRRCRMLQAGARAIVEAGMPRSRSEWLKVPGVGKYTAAAIASICYGEPCAVVDGNVERVHARYTGDPHSAAQSWADSVLDRGSPAEHNQAMMELGATICRPKLPACERCPISENCFAKLNNEAHLIPRPKARPEMISTTMSIRVPYYDGRFGLVKSDDGRWWKGLWTFPFLQSASVSTMRASALSSLSGSEKTVGKAASLLAEPQLAHLGTVKHTVTRHKLRLEAYLDPNCDANLTWYEFGELEKLPMPTPHRKILGLARLAVCDDKFAYAKGR
jgi:A/G-specific adenine glycosylase